MAEAAPQSSTTASQPNNPSVQGNTGPKVTEQPKATVVAAHAPPFRISPRRSFSDRWLKMLVYGPYGVGKSTFGLSAVDVPQMGDVLSIDAESGDIVLEDNDRIKRADEVEHVRVMNFMQTAAVHDYLKGHCVYRDLNTPEALDKLRATEAWLKGCSPKDIDKPRKFRTLVVDSLTEVERYCMYGLLGVADGTIITGKADEIDVAQWDEYRKQNMMIQTLVRALRDLPMHVIFICAQQYTQDEMKRMHYTPQMTGKLAGHVQGMMDIVGLLRSAQPDADGKAPRRLYVQPIERFDAKCRIASLKTAFVDDPTMGSFMKQIGFVK